MKTKTRIGGTIFVGLAIITVLVVLITGSGPDTLNNDPLPTVTSQGDRFASINLMKAGRTNDYVELSEDDLAQYPVLQAALQKFTDSGLNEIWYQTSEQEATAIQRHLEKKYCGDTPCIWNTIFKYNNNFYSYRLIMANTTPSTTTQTSLIVSETPFMEDDGLIELIKLTEIPDQYVDLTEEEVAEFPNLKTALQSMISSNKTYLNYDASEREGIRIRSVLTTKAQDKYNCSRGCTTSFFQYRGELYHFRLSISIVDGTTSTSEAPQTTTVVEGLSTLGVLILLGTGIGIFFGQKPKKGTHRP